jgi:hypothetical protein
MYTETTTSTNTTRTPVPIAMLIARFLLLEDVSDASGAVVGVGFCEPDVVGNGVSEGEMYLDVHVSVLML